MAKAKAQKTVVFIRREPKQRPNIHAKSKASKMKHSKHYLKRYRGQGR